MKACDVLAGIMIPTLLDPAGATPTDRWDFSKRYHVLTEHSQITKEQVLLWGEDCMLWGSNASPIADVTYERQDQDLIHTRASNSCSPGLNVKVKKSFSRLEGHQQAGVVYLWLMLHTIINITPDVASGLKDCIKLSATKGLRGLYPKRENVERMVLDYTIICDSLD